MGEAFRLGILTALWRRPAIAEAVLRHHVALSVPGVDITVCAVRSDEDDDPAQDVPGVLYANAQNDPVSDKWNAGMFALRGEDLDAVMIVGSDDLVSAGYVSEATQAIQAGASFARPLGLVFVDTETGRAHRSKLQRIGLGRTLPASLLDRVGYRPWPHGLSRRLDGGMDRRLFGLYDASREAGIPVGADLGSGPVEVVDLKSAVNLWDYETMLIVKDQGREPLNGHDYLNTFFPDTYSELMAKRKTTTKKAVAPKSKPDPALTTLVALKNLQPAWTGLGRRVFKGDRFEIPNRAAELLCRQKLAERA